MTATVYERFGYHPDDTVVVPYVLADPVPSWETLFAATRTLPAPLGWTKCTTADGEGFYINGVTTLVSGDTHCRWLAACAIAAACGFPPSWQDRGFVPGDETGTWWHEGSELIVYPPGSLFNERWKFYDHHTQGYGHCEFGNEADARRYAYELVASETTP